MPNLKLPTLTGRKLPDVNLPAINLPDIRLPDVKEVAKDLPGQRRRTVFDSLGSLVPLLVVGVITAVTGALLAFAFDPTKGRARRAQARDQLGGAARRIGRQASRRGQWVAARASGMLKAAQHADEPAAELDEVGLANRVKTELFRDSDIDKGAININAERGLVYLRGTARTPEQIAEIVERVSRIDGVDQVINLLHTASEAAPASEEAAQPVG
jgi:hypothetical protein